MYGLRDEIQITGRDLDTKIDSCDYIIIYSIKNCKFLK